MINKNYLYVCFLLSLSIFAAEPSSPRTAKADSPRSCEPDSPRTKEARKRIAEIHHETIILFNMDMRSLLIQQNSRPNQPLSPSEYITRKLEQLKKDAEEPLKYLEARRLKKE